jgi:uncharacterized protein YbaP (TraB family)
MDYKWMIEAAGKDEKRLAQLSMLLAGAAITAAQMRGRQGIETVLEMRAAIHEIGSIMGLDKAMDQAVRDVWGVSGQD